MAKDNDAMEQYAPVLIPTLNRYEHFKRCLESLEKCSLAEKTDVYVALDYPPSEKYVEGWRKVDSYLTEKEKSNGFNNLFVVRREQNYGVGKLGSNLFVLIEDIKNKYDRYILTEDDNEFSPCFLEYQNWALNMYKDDPRIVAVCGFKRVNVDFLKNNVYIYPQYNGWGIGQWFKKRERLLKLYTFENMSNYIEQFPLRKIFSNEVVFASITITQYCKKVKYGDTLIDFLPKDERYCVFPKVSMVRNYGHDGTGQHGRGTSRSYQMYMENPMDMSEHFEPIVRGDLYDKRLEKVYKKAYPISMKKRIHSMFTVFVYKVFKKYV